MKKIKREIPGLKKKSWGTSRVKMKPGSGELNPIKLNPQLIN